MFTQRQAATSCFNQSLLGLGICYTLDALLILNNIAFGPPLAYSLIGSSKLRDGAN